MFYTYPLSEPEPEQIKLKSYSLVKVGGKRLDVLQVFETQRGWDLKRTVGYESAKRLEKMYPGYLQKDFSDVWHDGRLVAYLMRDPDPRECAPGEKGCPHCGDCGDMLPRAVLSCPTHGPFGGI